MTTKTLRKQCGAVIIGFLIIIASVVIAIHAGIKVYQITRAEQKTITKENNISSRNPTSNAAVPSVSASFTTNDLNPVTGNTAYAEARLGTVTDFIVQRSSDPLPSGCILGDNCSEAASTIVSPDLLDGKDAKFRVALSTTETLSGMDSKYNASIGYDGLLTIDRLLGSISTELTRLPMNFSIAGNQDTTGMTTAVTSPVTASVGDNIRVNELYTVTFIVPEPGIISLFASGICGYAFLFLIKRMKH